MLVQALSRPRVAYCLERKIGGSEQAKMGSPLYYPMAKRDEQNYSAVELVVQVEQLVSPQVFI